MLSCLSALCALAGVALGWWVSRRRGSYWVIGFAIPFLLLLLYALAFHFPPILFLPPFSWMMLGIRKFAFFGFICALLLSIPLFRTPKKSNRLLIGCLMIVAIFFAAIWPFIAPMLQRGELSHLQTKIDSDGICLQSTVYTCGPAAAVTGLRKLGFAAEEGQVAILSCTSDLEGTPVDMLAEALRREYGKDGLTAECRCFKSVSELKGMGLVLALTKYGLLEDHWLVIFDVTENEVIVGDPLSGLVRLSHEEFSRRWRFIGIVLRRDSRI